jgi:GNAT superfamily N-acetyltransferase
MGVRLANESVSRNSPTRVVRLEPSPQTIGLAEAIYEVMKADRPHMASRLSKMLIKGDEGERRWNTDVVAGHVVLWVIKLTAPNGEDLIVSILWFEWVKESKTAHIEVLWTHPSYRQFGFGSQLVQSVLVRHPEVEKWTAFTSRDMKKDGGVHRFWTKQGFHQASIDVGKTTQDGFFIRIANAGPTKSVKRRRIQREMFEIKF